MNFKTKLFKMFIQFVYEAIIQNVQASLNVELTTSYYCQLGRYMQRGSTEDPFHILQITKNLTVQYKNEKYSKVQN